MEEYLTAAGLNDSEIDDFITFWLPEMQDNPYNLIAFQGELYEQVAELHVTPEPDSVLRIFMTFEALDEPVECGEFSMPESFERSGFAVVEWGGSELEKGVIRLKDLATREEKECTLDDAVASLR